MISVTREQKKRSQGNSRQELFWAFTGLSILGWFFIFACLFVPGDPGEAVFLGAVMALLPVIALLIGGWRYTTTDAPLMSSRAAPVGATLLLLQFLHGIAIIASSAHHLR